MSGPALDLQSLRRLSVAERIQLVEHPWDSIAESARTFMSSLPDLVVAMDSLRAEYARQIGR